MRMRVLSVLVLSLSSVACGRRSAAENAAAASALNAALSAAMNPGAASAATPPAAGAAAAIAVPAAPAPPAGPVFRATMMGMDMSRPLVATDLTPAGLAGLTLTAPEGASFRRQFGAGYVTAAGVNYSVSLREGRFNAAAARSGFRALDPQGAFLEDNASLVLFQRSNGGSVHFSTAVTVGTRTFTCGSVATAMDFTRDTVDQMVASCRTLRASGT